MLILYAACSMYSQMRFCSLVAPICVSCTPIATGLLFDYMPITQLPLQLCLLLANIIANDSLVTLLLLLARWPVLVAPAPLLLLLTHWPVITASGY